MILKSARERESRYDKPKLNKKKKKERKKEKQTEWYWSNKQALLIITKGYLGPCQISMIKPFVKIVNSFVDVC